MELCTSQKNQHFCQDQDAKVSINNSCQVHTLRMKDLCIQFGTIVLNKKQFHKVLSFLCLNKVVSPKRSQAEEKSAQNFT